MTPVGARAPVLVYPRAVPRRRPREKRTPWSTYPRLECKKWKPARSDPAYPRHIRSALVDQEAPSTLDRRSVTVQHAAGREGCSACGRRQSRRAERASRTPRRRCSVRTQRVVLLPPRCVPRSPLFSARARRPHIRRAKRQPKSWCGGLYRVRVHEGACTRGCAAPRGLGAGDGGHPLTYLERT